MYDRHHDVSADSPACFCEACGQLFPDGTQRLQHVPGQGFYDGASQTDYPASERSTVGGVEPSRKVEDPLSSGQAGSVEPKPELQAQCLAHERSSAAERRTFGHGHTTTMQRQW